MSYIQLWHVAVCPVHAIYPLPAQESLSAVWVIIGPAQLVGTVT